MVLNYDHLFREAFPVKKGWGNAAVLGTAGGQKRLIFV